MPGFHKNCHSNDDAIARKFGQLYDPAGLTPYHAMNHHYGPGPWVNQGRPSGHRFFIIKQMQKDWF
jgi:hypothetical protein